MRALSHLEMHGRDEMAAAIFGAGQFAHLSAATIQRSLGMVAHYGGAGAFARYWDVPDPGGPDRFNASVLRWIATAHGQGTICCLCGAIDRPPHNGSPQLARACCATWTSVDGPSAMESYPFCRKCGRTLERISEPFSKSLRTHYYRWKLDDERDIEIVLSVLLANPSFRGRVEQNAPNFSRLRFDPRREPSRRAA